MNEHTLEDAFAFWHETGDLHELERRFPDQAAHVLDLLQVRSVMHRFVAVNPGGPALDIPGYRLGREIGRGGMGIVYEAEQLALGRRVAIKVLLPEGSSDGDLRERMEREARAAASLRHEGLVTVHDVGEANGVPYIVMELVEGVPLRKAIVHTRDELPDGLPSNLQERIATIVPGFARLAGALAHAHARGIIHRDIKPGNILLCLDGSLKLVDFGLALDRSSTSMTQTGTPVGTPSTMSPEQARGEREKIGPRSDVYSLGASLYESLALTPAYRGGSFAETLALVARGEPPLLRKILPEFPPDLEAVILQAMAPDLRDRYADATEFQRDLDAFREGRTVRARRLGPLARGIRSVWRHPAPVLALLLIVGLGTAAALLTRSHQHVSNRLEDLEVESQIDEMQSGTYVLLLSRVFPPSEAEGLLERVKTLKEKARAHADIQFLHVLLLWLLDRGHEAKARFEASPELQRTGEGHLLAAHMLRSMAEEGEHRRRAEQLGFRSPKSLLFGALLERPLDHARVIKHCSAALEDPKRLGSTLQGLLRYTRGCALFGQGKLDEADLDLRMTSELSPGLWALRAARVPVLGARGHVDEAKALLAHIRAVAQKNPWDRIRIAKILGDLGATGSASRFLGSPPEEEEAHREWADLRIQLDLVITPSAEDLDQVLALCKRYPADPSILFHGGVALANNGRYAAGMEILDSTLAMFGQNPRYYTMRSWVHGAYGLSARAREDVARGRWRGMGGDRADSLAARTLTQAGDEAGAQTFLEPLLQTQADDPNALMEMARLHIQADRWNEARDCLERAHGTRPLEPDIAVNLARAYFHSERNNDCVRVLTPLIDGGLGGPELLVWRALAKLALEDGAGAQADFDNAAIESPHDVYSRLMEGEAYARLDQRSNAVRALRSALTKTLKPPHFSLILAGITRLSHLSRDPADQALAVGALRKLADWPLETRNAERLARVLDRLEEDELAGQVRTRALKPATKPVTR